MNERPENGELLVLWMYGPAGAGKSAIAQSIAELCEALLAASFFFSRTTEGRSDSSRLVATIVWQLIMAIPEIREIVLSSVERDPTILCRTPATQMKNLIVDPLNQVTNEILKRRPRLIIIDGLDECLPPRLQDDILQFLSASLKRLKTPLYFLVASRPHQNIQNIFMSDSFKGVTQTLPLEYDYQSEQDIRYFLTSSFNNIRREHPYLPTSWPNDSHIETVVKKSSGQFIYAATVMRYVDEGHHGHEKRFSTVLGLQSSNNTDVPFATLDELYLQIFGSIGKDEIEGVMEVLSARICLKVRVLEVLEEFFDYRRGELACVLRGISSLVLVPERRWDPFDETEVKIYHASLPDFLLDRTRSRSFYLDPPAVLLKLARRCIQGNRFRPSKVPDKMCYGDPVLRYARLFSECVLESPITGNLASFLLEFNLWDKLPIQFSLLFHNDICDASMNLLKKFQEQVCTCHFSYHPADDIYERQCEEAETGWTQIYKQQLRCLDGWIQQIFSLIPSDGHFMVIAAFSLHLEFTASRTHLILFEDLISNLPFLNMDGAFDAVNNHVRIRIQDFIAFILQRISIIFGPKYQTTDTDYTYFAYWCAFRASKDARYIFDLELHLKAANEAQILSGPDRPDQLGASGDVFLFSPFGIYLAAALNHCQESREIIDLLKLDNLQKLACVQKRHSSDGHIFATIFESAHDMDFSKYVEVASVVPFILQLTLLTVL